MVQCSIATPYGTFPRSGRGEITLVAVGVVVVVLEATVELDSIVLEEAVELDSTVLVGVELDSIVLEAAVELDSMLEETIELDSTVLEEVEIEELEDITEDEGNAPQCPNADWQPAMQ